jgi:hypothetical protein
MKKSLLFISALIAVSASFAQTSTVAVPNAGFELWPSGKLGSWSDSLTTVTVSSPGTSTVTSTTTTHLLTADSVNSNVQSGNKSIVVTSNQVNNSGLVFLVPGAMVSGNNASVTIKTNIKYTVAFPPTYTVNGTPSVNIQGQIPFNNTLAPSGLTGYYKYKSDSAITGSISVILFKGADTVGIYLNSAAVQATPIDTLDAASYAFAKQAAWTAFSFSLSPNPLKGLTSIPTTIDSVRIVVLTCMPGQIAKNKTSAHDSVFLDQLAFTYFVPAPVVSVSGHTLTSSVTTGNQWYMDGAPLSGQTSNTFVVTQSGSHSYTDVVTIDGVSSAASNAVLITAISNVLDGDQFGVSQNNPNPFSGTTSISFSTPNSGTVQFTVVDLLGRVVNSQTINANAGVNTITYAGSDSGTYFYTISDGVHSVTKKLVVSK